MRQQYTADFLRLTKYLKKRDYAKIKGLVFKYKRGLKFLAGYNVAKFGLIFSIYKLDAIKNLKRAKQKFKMMKRRDAEAPKIEKLQKVAMRFIKGKPRAGHL